ncbi:hypothetical protein M422DRAFT_276331 [Sphaerobolus stellatus SS14]|uniref:F-box domain-containing protein n=1 Tax=Sphaerobolus stellatus (strain SS14) TaxID=990650 RepID=A0A0C9UCG3_SPHS4|nr:hypothetical protein M422DRAFT_276331 [Sphaerobolus stellatus SS14]
MEAYPRILESTARLMLHQDQDIAGAEPTMQRSEANSVPIMKLPFDIIRKVFLLLVPSLSERVLTGPGLMNSPPIDGDDVHPDRLQYTLTLVCTRWNKYSKSIPGIWSTILFDQYLASLTQLEKKLQLSQGVPLHIYIKRRFLPNKPESNYLYRATSILCPHLSRMHSLFICIGQENLDLSKCQPTWPINVAPSICHRSAYYVWMERVVPI